MELSTPVIIGIVVVVLVILIILIVLGVQSSKRRKARQLEADRQRAAQLRDEARAQETTVQERDLEVRETELQADRAHLEAAQKAKKAEQDRVAAELRRTDAEKQRADVEQERGGIQDRLAEADRLDPDTPDDAPRDSDRLRHDDRRPEEREHLGSGAPTAGDGDMPAADPAVRSSGHGRRAARPTDAELPIDGAPERTPDDVDAPRTQQTPPADQQFGHPTEQGGRQTPPADQQFGRPEWHEAQNGQGEPGLRPEPRDAQRGEGDRLDEQDPFFHQQQQLREQDEGGELPLRDPESGDPQEGPHRG